MKNVQHHRPSMERPERNVALGRPYATPGHAGGIAGEGVFAQLSNEKARLV